MSKVRRLLAMICIIAMLFSSVITPTGVAYAGGSRSVNTKAACMPEDSLKGANSVPASSEGETEETEEQTEVEKEEDLPKDSG